MNPEFLSGEASASPAVEPLLAGAKALAKAGYADGVVAARNGPRTTLHANLPLDKLGPNDFCEVADFDPHLERLLCIGRRDPHLDAGMIHLMMRAKKEIGALVIVGNPPASTKGALPQAKPGAKPLDNAMAALEGLRSGEAVLLGERLLVTAPSIPKAFAHTRRLLGLDE